MSNNPDDPHFTALASPERLFEHLEAFAREALALADHHNHVSQRGCDVEAQMLMETQVRQAKWLLYDLPCQQAKEMYEAFEAWRALLVCEGLEEVV